VGEELFSGQLPFGNWSKTGDENDMAFSKKKGDGVSGEIANEAISSLDNTVGSFQDRLQRQLKQQAVESNKAQVAKKERGARVLQALNTIRRALQETKKIKLGQRFQLDLEVSDWNGWPRLEWVLIASLDSDFRDFGLIVTAHDRKESGSIEFKTRKGNLLGALSCTDDSALTKIPIILKKSVRSYLDSVAEYVLNPKSPEEIAEARIVLETEPIDPASYKLKDINVFSQENMSEYEENKVESVEETNKSFVDLSFEKA